MDTREKSLADFAKLMRARRGAYPADPPGQPMQAVQVVHSAFKLWASDTLAGVADAVRDQWGGQWDFGFQGSGRAIDGVNANPGIIYPAKDSVGARAHRVVLDFDKTLCQLRMLGNGHSYAQEWGELLCGGAWAAARFCRVQERAPVIQAWRTVGELHISKVLLPDTGFDGVRLLADRLSRASFEISIVPYDGNDSMTVVLTTENTAPALTFSVEFPQYLIGVPHEI